MKRADLRRCEKYREQGYVTISELRREDAALRRPQQREYLTTRITTIYDLLKTLRHTTES